MDKFDFDNYENLMQYWLQEDSLRPLDYDLFFSLGTRYYCDAGCKVCYIRKNLNRTKSLVKDFYNNDIKKMENIWFNIFDYFGCIRTNDDLFMLKQKFPLEWEWYKSNGKIFEFCLTDNAIFRTLRLDIELKSLGDVSISSEFINQVGPETVLIALKDLYNKFGIQKIKFIDCGDPKLFNTILDLAEKYNLNNCVHHDFRENTRKILNHTWAEYQNTWVINDNKGLMQIYRESLHLYYDRFYFSSDDASDLNEEAFYKLPGKFDSKELIYRMLKAKQTKYNTWSKRVIDKRFKTYYNMVQEYSINENFNFLPYLICNNKSRFYWKLVEDGWKITKFGLMSPDTKNITSVITK